MAFGEHIFVCKKFLDVTPSNEDILTEKDRFQAMLLLKSADDKRYSGLKATLHRGATLGRNEYPKKLSDMYELICDECPDQPTQTRNNNNTDNRNGTQLLQRSTNKSSTPSTPSSIHQLQLGVVLTQANNIINPNWICWTHAQLTAFSITTLSSLT